MFNEIKERMAPLDGSILDGASGKLDGYVIYKVGKKTHARKAPKTIANPRTEGQTAQRSKLPGAQTMHRAARGSVLERVYTIVAREEERRSGYHWFLHANMKVFGVNDYVDYPRLVLADGSLQLPFGMRMVIGDAGKVEVEWLDNTSTVTAQSTDRLMVAAIFDNEPYQPVVLENVTGCRADGRGVASIPGGEWNEVHLYCFFGAADGRRYSPCMYFSVCKS